MEIVRVRGRRTDSDDAAGSFDLRVDGRAIRVETTAPTLRASDHVDVWGEVVEHDLVAGAYRDAPDELPARIRAVAVAPVPPPPAILSTERRVVMIVFAVLVAVSMIPINATTPYYRFWMLLCLWVVVGSAHVKLAPPNLRPQSELRSMAVIVLYAALGILFYAASVAGAPAWTHVVAPALFVAQAWMVLLARRRRIRAMYRVADRALRGNAGIVTASADDWFDVAFDHEIRRFDRRNVEHAGVPPRADMRIVIDHGIAKAPAYASVIDPTAELAYVRTWERALAWLGALLAPLVGAFAYLALSS